MVRRVVQMITMIESYRGSKYEQSEDNSSA